MLKWELLLLCQVKCSSEYTVKMFPFIIPSVSIFTVLTVNILSGALLSLRVLHFAITTLPRH